MGFQVFREILAGTVLIAEAIQSQNFVTGVSGWQITAAGNAEFNNATIRGTLIVGDPTTGTIDVTGDIPAELSAFYTAQYGSTLLRASISWQVIGTFPNFDYYYEVAGRINPTNTIWASGWVSADKHVFEVINILFLDSGATSFHQVRYGQATQTNVIFGQGIAGTSWLWGSQSAETHSNTSTEEYQSGAAVTYDSGSSLTHAAGSVDNYAVGSTLNADGNAMPRGTIYYQSIAVAFNTPAAIGEVAAFTSNNMTFRKGRAYEVVFYNAKLKSAVAQNPAANLRETNLAGAILCQGPRWPVTGFDSQFSPQFVFVNNGGADVTTSLCLTLNPNAATAVTLDAAADPAQWAFVVNDIGDTNRYVGPHSV